MPLAQQFASRINKIVWASGQDWIVVTTSRSHHTHGNGFPAAPPLDLYGIAEWDQYFLGSDLNWPDIRYTFPSNHAPPPTKGELLALDPQTGKLNKMRVLRWGGFEQKDYGGHGGVGAQATKAKLPPPILNGESQPISFEPDGYTDGLIIHDLVVFNVPAIRAITGSDDFNFSIASIPDVALPGSGSDTPTYRQLYFPWATGVDITNEIHPFDFPTFPSASQPPASTDWNAQHPTYKDRGSAVSNAGVVMAWMFNHVNTGIPGVTYPPWDNSIVPIGGDSQAIMQAQVDWANKTFVGYNASFYLATGTIVDPGLQLTQPESHYTITVAHYDKPPIALNANAPNSSPVPFFPVNEKNEPQWNENLAKSKVTKTFGGFAPQPGRSIIVKLSKGTGGSVLTVTLSPDV